MKRSSRGHITPQPHQGLLPDYTWHIIYEAERVSLGEVFLQERKRRDLTKIIP